MKKDDGCKRMMIDERDWIMKQCVRGVVGGLVAEKEEVGGMDGWTGV